MRKPFRDLITTLNTLPVPNLIQTNLFNPITPHTQHPSSELTAPSSTHSCISYLQSTTTSQLLPQVLGGILRRLRPLIHLVRHPAQGAPDGLAHLGGEGPRGGAGAVLPVSVLLAGLGAEGVDSGGLVDGLRTLAQIPFLHLLVVLIPSENGGPHPRDERKITKRKRGYSRCHSCQGTT